VLRDGDKLYLDAVDDWMPGHELFPQSEALFFHLTYDRELDFDVAFITDETGHATGLAFEMGEERIAFDRLETESTSRTAVPPVESTDEPVPQRTADGSWWVWLLAPLALLAVLVIWYTVRKRL
jgi:hypothetical protein